MFLCMDMDGCNIIILEYIYIVALFDRLPLFVSFCLLYLIWLSDLLQSSIQFIFFLFDSFRFVRVKIVDAVVDTMNY